MVESTIRVRQPDGKDIEVPFSYKEQMVNALNQPPVDERTGQPRGFGAVEMRKRLKLIDIVEGAVGELLLEHSDWKELKECMSKQRWIILDEAIIKMCDDVENAEEVEVKSKID